MTEREGRRRTQAERTEETRGRLIHATIRSLREDGYRATTTRRIADYAGVSLGAVAHHFPSRAELITAALDAVAERMIASIEEGANAVPEDPSDISSLLLDTLWRNFTGDSFLVWLRVWLAAADDHELYDAVLRVDERLSVNLARILPPLVPPGISRADWFRRINVCLDAIRGLSLVLYYQPGKEPVVDRWPATKRELLRLLEG